VSTINVNLKLGCGCSVEAMRLPETGHYPGCSAAPVFIPCLLPPSVTFEVVLGECTCSAHGYGITKPNHAGACPARPMKVFCSISGKTWEESEVADWEPRDMEYLPTQANWKDVVEAACRERWAVVKALVLGKTVTPSFGPENPLMKQRDAAYAALVAKARMEQADDATTRDLMKALPSLKMRDVTEATASAYLSGRALAHYVEHLIEQVGALSPTVGAR
jgi:hypothetical protein